MNDATGLVALELSVALLLKGQHLSFSQGSFYLLYLIVAGVATGLLVAWLMHWVQTLHHRFAD